MSSSAAADAINPPMKRQKMRIALIIKSKKLHPVTERLNMLTIKPQKKLKTVSATLAAGFQVENLSANHPTDIFSNHCAAKAADTAKDNQNKLAQSLRIKNID